MQNVSILVTNRDVDLFCRKSNQIKGTTHQVEAVTNQIKARKIFFLQH